MVTPKPSRECLPRLPREYYQGDAVISWTLPILKRTRGWLTEDFHDAFRELMLHAAAREGLVCPVYCLMPDHLHLVWMGIRIDTDQLNGMAFLRRYLEPHLVCAKFQIQAHDRVLREKERKRNAFAAVCTYVASNPVRAHLVEDPRQWAFTDSVVPGYPELKPLESRFWPTFWRIYLETRHPNAGEIRRPPI
jgi:putative transposase